MLAPPRPHRKRHCSVSGTTPFPQIGFHPEDTRRHPPPPAATRRQADPLNCPVQ